MRPTAAVNVRSAVCVMALCVASAAAAAKPAVAVLYFDYDGKSEELAVLKKGLAQMLISDLSASDDYSVVERARLQEVLEELKLQGSNKVDPATAAKIGKLLGARYLVMGGFFELMGTLRLDARVVDVETGKTLKGAGANGKQDDFLSLEQKVSAALQETLSRAAMAAAAAPTPTEPAPKRKGKRLPMRDAVRYSKALDALDKKDPAAAKVELQAVVKAQPDFELAAIDLASLMK